MDKEFVTYEIALALKELGFKEDCLASYYHAGKRLDICEYINHGKYKILAPLKQQVIRWFREKYDLYSYIFPWIRRVGWGYDIPNESSAVKQTNDNTFTSYEEAENACIDKLIEIAKQQAIT